MACLSGVHFLTSTTANCAKTLKVVQKIAQEIGRGRTAPVFAGLLKGKMCAVKEYRLQFSRQNNTRSMRDGAAAPWLVKYSKEVAGVAAEVNLLKGLRHKNIVGYEGMTHSADGDVILVDLVVECVVGGTVLAAQLKRTGPLDTPEVNRAANNLITGLQYLHDKQLVHGSILTSTVYVDNKGVYKLAYFGSAKPRLWHLAHQQEVFPPPKARCAFSDRNLHSRMPLDPTHVHLKRTCV
jgi:serine/threonine protein kinase